jgi:hypothetical protein
VTSIAADRSSPTEIASSIRTTRIFSQDAAYHFTATNSGQFFYNLSISGTPGETRHVTLELPWPFVTQGAQPVHVYDSVEFVDGCFKNYTGAYSFDNHTYLKDYHVDYPTVKTGYLPSLKTNKVELEVVIPESGFAFIRQHMDDGLKGPYVDVNGDGVQRRYFLRKEQQRGCYESSERCGSDARRLRPSVRYVGIQVFGDGPGLRYNQSRSVDQHGHCDLRRY